MTTTRTTIAGIDGVASPVEGLDVALRARSHALLRDLGLAAAALAVLVLLAL